MIPIMTYTFDTILAQKYGVNEAIMLNNFIYWIAKNEANDKHFHDGRYWTYNSVAAFEKLFPFWSNKQIRNVLASLERQGVLLKGNYNEQKYDRTCWYAFTDAFVKSISQNGKIDLPKTANGIDEKGEPIPDNKPNNKNPYIKPATTEAVADAPQQHIKKFSYRDKLIAAGVTAENADRLLANRKANNLKNTEAAYNKLMGALEQVCNGRGVTYDEAVEYAGKKGWGFIDPSWNLEGLKARRTHAASITSIGDIIKRDLSHYAD